MVKRREQEVVALGVVAQHAHRVRVDRKIAVERRIPALDGDPVRQPAVALDHDRRVRVASDEHGIGHGPPVLPLPFCRSRHGNMPASAGCAGTIRWPGMHGRTGPPPCVARKHRIVIEETH
ncbi:MAG: hypothetical protein LBJ65_23955 [Burkholderia sp.]|uniref:hypothetical protein n=1 Tax=Burkholderia sp. TaxID=36773 RepID=UPI002826A214|nr:hypothetical protein [Burkholderia sp.]MDR0244665.1 hypothetical protein [Burkholderia sp.]